MNNKWTTLASEKTIKKTIAALKERNITAVVVKNGEEAKKKVFELLPKGAEVMTNTSVTLDTLGISEEINTSGNYNAVRPKLFAMDRNTQGVEMNKLGSAPEWAIGSVHAVTQEGNVVIASNSGSQLPGYAYGSQHVILVVSTQKIVDNLDQAMNRVYEHSLPLESERAKKAYGVAGSYVSKMLILNKENIPNRITLIFVEEQLGF